MNVLGSLFSAGDRMKRKLGGLLSDPAGTIALGSQRMAEDTNILARLASEAGYMPNTVNRADQSVLVGPQQKALARALLADKGAEMGMAGATVWHGSPHKFDKFDSSKIGTGEGAQAYGHGLYLAENQTTAGTYAAANRGRGAATDGLLDSLPPGIQVDAMRVLNMKDGPIRDAMLRDLMQTNPKESQRLAQIAAEKAGNMYKVDLPDNAIARMLDWDKPLSQQPKVVRDAYKKHLQSPQASDHAKSWTRYSDGMRLDQAEPLLKNPGGENLYKNAFPSREAANQWAIENGIPGIRYLDGGSRGAGQGSSNFVVFPGQEDILKILERNGVPIK